MGTDAFGALPRWSLTDASRPSRHRRLDRHGRHLSRHRTGLAGDRPAMKPQPPAIRSAILVLIAIGLAYALARVLFGLP